MAKHMWLELCNPDHRFHLTIIHAKQELPDNFVRTWLSFREVIRCRVIGEDRFGPERNIRVALVEYTSQLGESRLSAETMLDAQGITWSTDFPFTPHVTIGDAPLPKYFDFTHFRWQ
jgi:hypothetical protein